MLTKILAFLLLLTLALSAFLGIYNRHTDKQLKQVNAQLLQSRQEVVDLKSSIEKQSKISDMTEDVVTKAVVRTAEITKRTSSINQKIDKTSQEVKDGKIDPSFAAATYVDSMWDAYCEASPSSDHCTARQSSTKLPR